MWAAHWLAAASMDRELIGRGRVEALSDGVFAIVITLLVLELHAPRLAHDASPGAVFEALGLLAPKFVSWVISFVTVCVIWVNHHRLFAAIGTVDTKVFWLNANLLLWTSFIPFPTALMGDLPASAVAVSFYGLVMGLMALGFVLLRWYLQRHRDLIDAGVDLARFRRSTRFSIAMGPLAYATGAALAWVNQPAAFGCYAAIALYFVLPHGARTGVRMRQ